MAWLLFATVLWGASFPLAKALVLAQRRLLPDADSWFLSALALTIRFALAAALLAAASARTLGLITRLEFVQGAGLGILAAGGMLFQMDGLCYTAASTSAFLTSCYCVIIPVMVACRRRRRPPARVALACALVLIGAAALAGVDWRTLRLGRGEAETIVASVFFAAQIIWLGRPRFAANRTGHSTLVMFATMALTALPLALQRCPSPRDFALAAMGSRPIVGLLVALTLGCTLLTFTLMNHWQRDLDATEAGLVYCVEPVWTSLWALFLPAWLTACCLVEYPNESPTVRLLVGGALITAANVCVQIRRRAV